MIFPFLLVYHRTSKLQCSQNEPVTLLMCATTSERDSVTKSEIIARARTRGARLASGMRRRESLIGRNADRFEEGEFCARMYPNPISHGTSYVSLIN